MYPLPYAIVIGRRHNRKRSPIADRKPRFRRMRADEFLVVALPEKRSRSLVVTDQHGGVAVTHDVIILNAVVKVTLPAEKYPT